MNLEIIKNLVTDYLKDSDLKLYSIKLKKEYGMSIVEILLDSEKSINIDELAVCNTYLANKLDEYDENWDEYYLEVSSAGAEKELYSLDSVKNNINKYVFVKINNLEIEGKLINVLDEVLEIKVNLKGRMKTYKLNYNEITFIRLSIHL